MPQKSQNSQNSRRDSSASVNPFALLAEDLQPTSQDDTDTIVVPSPSEPRREAWSGRRVKPSHKRQQDNSPPP